MLNTRFSFERALHVQNPQHFLLRHAAPEFQKGRCLGQFDAPLSDIGFKHAQLVLTLHPKLQTIRAIVSSDLLRARQTADAIAAKLDLAPSIDARWRELDMGSFTNRSWDEIHQNDPEALARWGRNYVYEGPPNGESFLALQTRVLAAYQVLEPQSLIVTHEGCIRALLAALSGIDLQQAMQIKIDYAEVIPI